MSLRRDLFAWMVSQDVIATDDPTAPGALGLRSAPALFPHAATTEAPRTYTVFRRNDTPDGRTLNAEGGIRQATFDFETWSDDSDTVEQITEVLRDLFEGLKRVRIGSTDVIRAFLLGEVDDDIDPEDGSKEREFVTTLTVRFTYSDR